MKMTGIIILLLLHTNLTFEFFEYKKIISDN